MKTYKYKLIGVLLLLTFGVKAQTFDKKIKESFKVNANAIIEVNATHTDVQIETWNKNEVSIEAVIVVEGVTKEEADKIFKKWKFEALGNKTKVKISSKSESMDFDFDFPDIDIPHFEMPEMPEMPRMAEMPEIEIKNFDYDLYKKDSTYLKKYKIEVQDQVEKFKNSGWKKKLDSLRNSAEFKRSVEESKRVVEEYKKEMLENKDLMKDQIKVAKEASKMAAELIKKMKEEGKFDSIRNQSENFYFNYNNSKNSKIEIKKTILIKVPKDATFDLNVRHGKLNVPTSNTKMSANISYGNFLGGKITGSKNELTFLNSPVKISSLSSSIITLKNVPNAMFGTFEDVNLFSNSSNVFIEKIIKNVALGQKFGTINISNLATDFVSFNLILDYTKANIELLNSEFYYKINSKNSTVKFPKKLTVVKSSINNGIKYTEGFLNAKNSKNKLSITSIYSTLTLK